MAVKTMADYLSEVTADYFLEVLDIPVCKVLPEDGDKMQEIHEFDDGSIRVMTLSSQSYFDIEVQWQHLIPADAGTIRDRFHNNSKGKGRERTWYWQHPEEDNIYTVRFVTRPKAVRDARASNYIAIPAVVLRVEGVKPS